MGRIQAFCGLDCGCETLKGFFAFAPVLKDKLEAIRKELGRGTI